MASKKGGGGYHSAKTGRFVTKAYATSHKGTTVKVANKSAGKRKG